MKLTITLLAFFIIDIEARSYVEMNETEYEETFHILSDNGSKKILAEELKKVEKQINDENEKLERGEATFTEKLNPFSNMPKKDFEMQKEGGKMPPGVKANPFLGDRYNGVIEPSEEIKNDPINRAKLEKAYEELDRDAPPPSFDASSLGIITPAKDQKRCGACVAFASTGLHEMCMKKAGVDDKLLLDLSEQQLIDCGYNGGSMDGCDGSYPHAYTEFFVRNGGEGPHENSYPYLNRNPKLFCPRNIKPWNSGAWVTEQFYDYRCNADKMKKFIARYGAIAASMYASDRGFINYAGGVFNGCSSKLYNHVVMITGYGTDVATGKDYWIIKNSWGTDWGENGFAKIERGVNECGIEKTCVVAKCSLKGVPEEPAKPKPIPAVPKCDISKTFRPGITGKYSLVYDDFKGGSLRYSDVECKNSICQPLEPGPTDACVYICGKKTC